MHIKNIRILWCMCAGNYSSALDWSGLTRRWVRQKIVQLDCCSTALRLTSELIRSGMLTLMSLGLNSVNRWSSSKLVSPSCLKMSSVSGICSGSSERPGTRDVRSDWDSSPSPAWTLWEAPFCWPTATEAAS